MNKNSPSYVKTWANHILSIWKEWFAVKASKLDDGLVERDHFIYLRSKIDDFIKHPKEYKQENQITIPPGSPIGTNDIWGCDF